jgi:DNA-directed RNA polymerase subunit omega
LARITIEDCLKKIPSRFLLVNMVAKRVRQIREGSEYLVSSPKNEDIVVSLREIAAGKLTVRRKEKEAAQLPASDLEAESLTDPQLKAAQTEAAAEEGAAGAEAQQETEAAEPAAVSDAGDTPDDAAEAESGDMPEEGAST